MKTTAFLYLAVVLLITLSLLPGCGGGGGGGGSVFGTISGSVTDVAGNYIPGADIEVVGESPRTKSLFNGTYKLERVTTGWVTVKASAVIDGEEWLGMRAVQVYNDGPTQSMDIVMGPVTQLGEFRGVVTNSTGRPLENARVFASAAYPSGAVGLDTSFVSMVTFTDDRGQYRLTNVPSRIKINGVNEVIEYRVVASYAGQEGMPIGFANQQQIAITDPGSYEVVNFALNVSTSIEVPTPADWYIDVTSWTLPDDIITRGPNAYDTIRAEVSDSFARMLAARKAISRTPPLGSLIEIDVDWKQSWTEFLDAEFNGSPPANLAGFAIYRHTGLPPTVSDADLLDFVRDPFLMFYADTSDTLSVGRSYYYGVTAVSTSYLDQFNNFNPDSESTLSDIEFVTPIAQVHPSSPLQSAVLTDRTPTFSWMPLSGAVSYQVLLYSGYPVVDRLIGPIPDHIPPYWESDIVTGTSVTYDGTPLGPGTYYWVVIASSGADLIGPAYSVGELRSFRVQ